MEKPLARVVKFYNYNKCSDYLISKYELPNLANGAFWSYITNRGWVDNNGSFMTMSSTDTYAWADWVCDIVKLFLEEFGDIAEDDSLYVTFLMSW